MLCCANNNLTAWIIGYVLTPRTGAFERKIYLLDDSYAGVPRELTGSCRPVPRALEGKRKNCRSDEHAVRVDLRVLPVGAHLNQVVRARPLATMDSRVGHGTRSVEQYRAQPGRGSPSDPRPVICVPCARVTVTPDTA